MWTLTLEFPLVTKYFFPNHFKIRKSGTSVVVQWFRLHTPSAGCVSSVPGWESSTCCVVWPPKIKICTFLCCGKQAGGQTWHVEPSVLTPAFCLLVSLPPAPSSAVCQTVSVLPPTVWRPCLLCCPRPLT